MAGRSYCNSIKLWQHVQDQQPSWCIIDHFWWQQASWTFSLRLPITVASLTTFDTLTDTIIDWLNVDCVCRCSVATSFFLVAAGKGFWKSVRTWQSDGQKYSAPLSVHGVVIIHTHIRFTALFPGPPRWAGARRELLDFMVQGKINRGRCTDHPAGHHSTRTNQCHLHHPINYRPDALPAAPPTEALKATSAFGLGRRR